MSDFIKFKDIQSGYVTIDTSVTDTLYISDYTEVSTDKNVYILNPNNEIKKFITPSVSASGRGSSRKYKLNYTVSDDSTDSDFTLDNPIAIVTDISTYNDLYDYLNGLEIQDTELSAFKDKFVTVLEPLVVVKPDEPTEGTVVTGVAGVESFTEVENGYNVLLSSFNSKSSISNISNDNYILISVTENATSEKKYVAYKISNVTRTGRGSSIKCSFDIQNVDGYTIDISTTTVFFVSSSVNNIFGLPGTYYGISNDTVIEIRNQNLADYDSKINNILNTQLGSISELFLEYQSLDFKNESYNNSHLNVENELRDLINNNIKNINDLLTKVQKNASDIEANQLDIAGLKTDVQGINETLSDQKTTLGLLQKNVLQNSTDLASQNTKINTLSRNLNKTDTNVSENLKNIRRVTVELESLKAKTQNDFSTLDTNFSGRLVKLETEINNKISKKVSENKELLDGLSTEVLDLQNNFNNTKQYLDRTKLQSVTSDIDNSAKENELYFVETKGSIK